MDTLSSVEVEAERLGGTAGIAAAMWHRSAKNRNTLEVQRRDIVFYNVSLDRVRIEITLRNTGAEASQETQAYVSAAPFGAFVPWEPLLVLPVPVLLPGEAVMLGADAQPSRPGRPRVPGRKRPRRRRTGVDAAEPEKRGGPSAVQIIQQAWEGVFSKVLRTVEEGDAGVFRLPVLPADPNARPEQLDAVWAGNLSVFVDSHSVEVHCAPRLGVCPERLNVVQFYVGSGDDAYAFDVAGEAADWNVELRDAPIEDLLMDGSEPRLPLGQWIESRTRRDVCLVTKPPRSCTASRLEVHVRQRSSGREAVVEFRFAPESSGVRCYTLSAVLQDVDDGAARGPGSALVRACGYGVIS